MINSGTENFTSQHSQSFIDNKSSQSHRITMRKEDLNEEFQLGPLVLLLLGKVTNSMVRRQSHLIGCNYTCTLFSFHFTYGHSG